ncbi:fibronectin type III domain-containing protein [Geotalea toluenoxydans]|uniref:fibronectin type III domain-containing protein n=1 Tax=Geotalea toluenoxydans TaxID=421624 RepID=UPI001FB29F59|nr:hypothetical protein [Geotalea toluenoxydans]
MKLEGEDLSGNIASQTISVSIDNTPPQTPLLLTAVATNSDVALTWRANTEPDLAGYLLYRNDQLANGNGLVVRNLKSFALTGTSYTDKGLPDGKYLYALAAIDQAGNVSGLSGELPVTVEVRPPHATIVEPASNQKFGGRINIRAESVDNDIASIQFRYKKLQDTGWMDLGAPVTASPFAVTLDPQALGITYGDYQLQALATDQGGNPDPAPIATTVNYTDVTPPAPPANLKISTDGTSANLSWDANTESDIDGYNIYRTSGSERKKINAALVKPASFQDVNLADGMYHYEITAVDSYTNESSHRSAYRQRSMRQRLLSRLLLFLWRQSKLRVQGQNRMLQWNSILLWERCRVLPGVFLPMRRVTLSPTPLISLPAKTE